MALTSLMVCSALTLETLAARLQVKCLNWVALLVPALVGWALEVDSGAYFQSLQRLADACREAAQELADVSDHSCLLEYILAVRAMLTQAQEDCITLGRVCAPASP